MVAGCLLPDGLVPCHHQVQRRSHRAARRVHWDTKRWEIPGIKRREPAANLSPSEQLFCLRSHLPSLLSGTVSRWMALGTLLGYFSVGLGRLQMIVRVVLREVLRIKWVTSWGPGSAENFGQGDGEVVGRLRCNEEEDQTQ